MRSLKSLGVSAALVVALFGMLTPSSADGVPDEQWSVNPNSYPSGGEYQGLQIKDDFLFPISDLVGNVKNDPAQTDQRLCANVNDSFCDRMGSHFNAVIPVCTQDADTNCLVALDAITESGTLLRGKFTNTYLPETSTSQFPAAPDRNLPQGAYPSVWTIDGLPNSAGTTTYLASVQVSGSKADGTTTYRLDSYSMAINAITIVNGAYSAPIYKDVTAVDTATCAAQHMACGMQLEATTGTDQTACASVGKGTCALRQTLPANVRFRLTVRLSQSPTGWFHGRVQSPDVTISQAGNNVTVTVEGAPVQVPQVGIIVPGASLSESMWQHYAIPSGGSWGSQGPHGRRNQIAQPSPDSELAFSEYALWRDILKDTASASPMVWSVRTLNVPGGANNCFRDTGTFLGFVTTNSMIYAPGPPTFSANSQTLDYRVASPHYTSKSATFLGTYDLAMKASVARCVYGFSSAPISATVSIVSADGNDQVATTSVSLHGEWLHLAAYGFTFSNPTVKVKLTQEQPKAEPTPSASASATATASTSAKPGAKPTTITCVKGKTTKKVTAVNPKCPVGYKKKG